jgi:hypothetical protein
LTKGGVTHVQHNRNEHQPRIERNQWGIFHQTILVKQTLLNNPEEVIVEAGVDETDDDLGYSVPVPVDLDVGIAHRRGSMRGNELVNGV